MSIQSITIREYRNIQNLNLELSPQTNIFTGLNGEGKTNFLEAIYFALRGSSFRTSNNQDLIRKTEDKRDLTCISMSIQRGEIKDHVHSVILPQKKITKLNEKPVTMQKLLSEFPLVLFSPDSLSAIKDGPEERRDLMNDMLLLGNPQTHRVINDYQKALRARNKFLKSHLDVPQKIDFELLGALSETLFNLAIELIEARRKIIRAITPTFLKTVYALFQEETEVGLGYLMSDEDVLSLNPGEIEDRLHQKRLEVYTAELASGSTLWGPHKHDLSVTYGGNSARYFCSQGQQRSLILALKISQTVHHFDSYGRYPSLLLDDVFSELDKNRRAYLLDFVSGLKTQSVLTCADLISVNTQDLRQGLFATVYEVRRGSVQNTGIGSAQRGDLVRSKSSGDSAEGLLR